MFKSSFYAKMYAAMKARPELPQEFLNVGWSFSNKWSQSQLTTIQYMIKDLNVIKNKELIFTNQQLLTLF